MIELPEFLNRTLLNNAYWQWLLAALVTLLALLLGVLIRRWMRERYRVVKETEEVELTELPLEVASKTGTFFLIAIGLYAGLTTLELPPDFRQKFATVFTVVGFWQLGVWGSTAVLAWLLARRRKASATDRAAVGSLGIIGFILRMLVWTLVLLLTLDNLGVDITALVAGLGVGGIAVALAVQSILGDLFASLSITLDRPFVAGDFIIVDDFLGSVEQIGVKSTRLRSLGGEQIILSNADLLSSRIRNYGRMQERRVVFPLGVTYDTPRAKLETIPGIIRGIVEGQSGTRFDRSHFQKYGDFSLIYETVYYVLSPDYNKFMDVQQSINFAIHESFEREGIGFAYLTQRPWLTSDKGPASA